MNRKLLLGPATLTMIALCAGARADDAVYATYGVHNLSDASTCSVKNCNYERAPGEPTDPYYPLYWTSNWTMYRIFNRYTEFSPPYAGKPPAPLREGKDYEVSNGITYYDLTWGGPTGKGAMMEHYEKRCLPIFPILNTYTCSFVSLGEVAFFVTYPEDRPKGMPPVCLFSSKNHPPETDFIKHLPYATGDSARLGGSVQAYSFWVEGQGGGRPVQTGAAPDRTAEGDILFGFAFESAARSDRSDPSAAPYRHPQSFYFSGYPTAPADAAIVSQNYTDFAMIKPDPKNTWDRFAGLDISKLPQCRLFEPATPAATAAIVRREPNWGDLAKVK